MEISKTSKIIGGPVKKEYKAPFVSSALVFNDIVGFCFRDFCKNIYVGYKNNEDVQYTPEYIFAKMITLKGMKSQGYNARKLALDLIFLMNYSYRPWYINNNKRDQIVDFEELDIDLCNPKYLELLTSIAAKLEHPYIAIAFAMFTDNKTLEFDSIKFSESLCGVINNHAIYKYCRDNNLFDHDKVLLALYEIIHEDILKSEDRFNFRQLTRIILSAVQQRSQTLLMFAHYFSSNHNEKKQYAKAFLGAPNYSNSYSYSTSLYKNTVSDAITYSDWMLFDHFFGLLSKDMGSDNPEVQEFFKSAAAKRIEKENNSSQANNPTSKKLNSKLNHYFSPYLATAVDLADVNTKNLFSLIILLEELGDKRGLFLIREKLKYIFPSERTVFTLLYDLISNHVIKIEENHFDLIPESKINLWESYLNAPFEVNIIGFTGDRAILLSILHEELLRRSDVLEVCFNAWKALSYSYFYSSYEYYSGNVTDEWIQEYEIPEDFKKKISDAKLSCRKFSYIAFSAVKNAVSFHHMGESTGNSHTRNMMTYYLKKYLNLAETSPNDYSKPRMQSAPIFQVEHLISHVTGITPEDMYNLVPSLNFLDQ
ncbi:hypothetical protein JZM39_06120 [Acinetobacter pittii]|uniref:hypothetical protein n=1 Tax=Acinetobacter pittii TaxID=48296 RepID=UPI0019808061|nr:hypothetical protein [Acinetobacter pittii]MBN6535352.1 hypothetical protein [Acinetobacter pittii]